MRSLAMPHGKGTAIRTAIAYLLTALILCLGCIAIGGLINLAFRKPFLSRWKRDVSMGVSTFAGDQLYNFIPVPARLPAGVIAGGALLITIIWLCAKPGKIVETPEDKAS